MSGKIHFEVDGVAYAARLGVKAIAAYKAKFDASLLDAIGSLENSADDIDLLAGMFWALLDKRDDFTVAQVIDLMDDFGFYHSIDLIASVALGGMPEAAPVAGSSAPKKASKPKP